MSQVARRRYLANQILTASPERLVTLMYDALAANLASAAAAIAGGDQYEASQLLIKSQGIVLELQRSLRPDLWDGGPRLLAVYHFLYKRLVHANLTKDAAVVGECLGLVSPLQRAWHAAADQLAAERSAVHADAAVAAV